MENDYISLHQTGSQRDKPGYVYLNMGLLAIVNDIQLTNIKRGEKCLPN